MIDSKIDKVLLVFSEKISLIHNYIIKANYRQYRLKRNPKKDQNLMIYI